MLPHMVFQYNAILNEENRRQVQRNFNIERRLMRDTSDPFSLSDIHFKQLFRLNKDMVQFLIAELQPHMHHGTTYHSIHPTLRIFSALLFFGTGSYQRLIGQSYNLSMSQQSISRSVKEMSRLIDVHLDERFIVFPQTPEAKMGIKQTFMEKSRFPGVIGAIDCTHVAILSPHIEEHNYLNRKGYHSKNVQIICDYNLKILNINAQFPGACHDAYIWRNSAVNEELSQCHAQGDHNSWLLGDSGYPQQPWLMTPVMNPLPGSPEERYNVCHACGRNCIERCNGVLKGRFRCLSGERRLRYSPQNTVYIVNACAVLHNICVEARLDLAENEIRGNNDAEIVVNLPPNPGGNNDSRRLLIANYFQN